MSRTLGLKLTLIERSAVCVYVKRFLIYYTVHSETLVILSIRILQQLNRLRHNVNAPRTHKGLFSNTSSEWSIQCCLAKSMNTSYVDLCISLLVYNMPFRCGCYVFFYLTNKHVINFTPNHSSSSQSHVNIAYPVDYCF